MWQVSRLTRLSCLMNHNLNEQPCALCMVCTAVGHWRVNRRILKADFWWAGLVHMTTCWQRLGGQDVSSRCSIYAPIRSHHFCLLLHLALDLSTTAFLIIKTVQNGLHYTRGDQPKCVSCHLLLTTMHILLECPTFENLRHKHFNGSSFRNLL